MQDKEERPSGSGNNGKGPWTPGRHGNISEGIQKKNKLSPNPKNGVGLKGGDIKGEPRGSFKREENLPSQREGRGNFIVNWARAEK